MSQTSVRQLNDLMKRIYSAPLALAISDEDHFIMANKPSPFGSRVTDTPPDTSDDSWRQLMKDRGLPPVDRAAFLAAHGMMIPAAMEMDGLKLLECIYGDGDADLPF